MKTKATNTFNQISTIASTALIATMLSIGNAIGSDDDHDRAHKLKQAGEILPLEQIIEKAHQHHQGRILETELEREDGRYVYELALLDDNGTVWEFEFDAKTGELIKQEKED